MSFVEDGREQFERWYHWAGVPAGTPYAEADRLVSEAVARLEDEREVLLAVLRDFVDMADRVRRLDQR
jgi:hypothetical protein